MKYIYDIVLNFQDNFYNFFEWKREDKIKNISKIPLYRVSDKDILILKNNKVKVSLNFVNKLKETTPKLFCLVSNGKISIGLLFNKEGLLLKRSSLIFEEEEEANLLVKTLKPIKINYEKNIKVNNKNKLRIELEKKSRVINYINNNNEPLSLKYLYYEYFEKENNNIDNIKKELTQELSKEWTIKHNNIYNIINILTK